MISAELESEHCCFEEGFGIEKVRALSMIFNLHKHDDIH